MKKAAMIILVSFLSGLAGVPATFGQAKLSTHWEELSAAEFRQAIEQSKGTCLLPFVIL